MSLGCLRIISTTSPLSISGDVVSLRSKYWYGTKGWLNPFKLTASWASNLKSFSRIIYISSTSVYQSGDVDELTIPKPITKLGIRRLSIEKKWQKLNTRTVIVRPGGIYSNSSNILTKYLEGDHKIIFKKNHGIPSQI